MGADDFIQRVEMALYAFGFNGDNSIGARWAGHERPVTCQQAPAFECTCSWLRNAALTSSIPALTVQPW